MPAKEITGPLAGQLTEIAKQRRYGKRGPKVDFAVLKKSTWYDFSDEYKRTITVYAAAKKQGWKIRAIKQDGKIYAMILSKLEIVAAPVAQTKAPAPQTKT